MDPAVSGRIDLHAEIMGFVLQGPDIVLLITAPFCGALGAIAFFLFMAATVSNRGAEDSARQMPWYVAVPQGIIGFIGHLGLGLVVGLLIAFVFLGSIQNEASAVGKVLALTILIGYQAPNFWRMQESMVKKTLEKQMKEFQGDSGKK